MNSILLIMPINDFQNFSGCGKQSCEEKLLIDNWDYLNFVKSSGCGVQWI